MGVVFAATHLQLEQRVAIKVLLEDGTDPKMRERFAREARAASKIRSEHVAHVLDVGELGSGVPYMVMEYLVGEDLARRVKTRGAVPAVEAVGYVLQACEALAEAHVAGIVHRDLKPANVFLARRADGSIVVKLLDFGVSKVAVRGAEHVITAGAAVLGSPTYMPPEQIRSARDVDARGDLWSLGVMLFELITARPPFRADTLPELCVCILEKAAPELSSLAPAAPPGLGEVLARCLEKEPSARYESLVELASALEPFGPAEGRVSVERVTRILRAPSPPDFLPAQVSSEPEILRLQDAATVDSGEGVAEDAWQVLPPSSGSPGGQTAHSVVSSTAERKRRDSRPGALFAAAGVVLVAGFVAAAIFGLHERARADGPATAIEASIAESPPPSASARAVSVEPLPARELLLAPPVSYADAAAPPAAMPRKAPAAAMGTAPAPLKIKTRPRAVASAETPTPASGTEGFGDRK